MRTSPIRWKGAGFSALALAWSLSSSMSAVIFNDALNYPAGNITATSGGVWVRHSGANNDSLEVNYAGSPGASAGARYEVNQNRTDDVHRWFDPVNTNGYSSGTLYVSFVLSATGLPASPGGTYFAHFMDTGIGFRGRLFALTTNANTGLFRLGVAYAAPDFTAGGGPNRVVPTDLALNTDYQVVMKLDLNSQTATLWVNPASESNPSSGITTDVPGITEPVNGPMAAFAFRQSLGEGVLDIRNLIVGTNFAGVVTNVPAIPVIGLQPISVANYSGNPAALQTAASGMGVLSYQWVKNGLALPGATAPVLNFPSLQGTDSGSYFCRVWNAAGTNTTLVASVTVNTTPTPPGFSVQPQNATNFLGSTVVFSAAASGTGPLAYQWSFNAIPLTDGANPLGFPADTCVISGSQTPTLTLTGLSSNETGLYSLSVAGGDGNNTSSNAQLTVLPSRAVSIAFLRSLEDTNTWLTTDTNNLYTISGVVITATNLTSGNTASYFIQDSTAGINLFVTGSGGPLFRPQLGDQVIATGQLASFNSQLELECFTSNPAETYAVLSHSNALPAPIFLAPTFTNDLAFAESVEGSLVTMTNLLFGTNAGGIFAAGKTVTVTDTNGVPFALFVSAQVTDLVGRAIPAFAWSVTGVLGQVLANTGTPRNAGYELIVTRYADIVTNPPPVIVIQPQSLVATQGTRATFSLVASGAPPLSYQWQLNGTNLAGSTRIIGVQSNILTIFSVSLSDAGTYQALVANAGGSVTSAPAALVIPSDSDGNGLPDAWELQYFGHLGIVPNGDADGDGMSNLNEYLARTSPTDPASKVAIGWGRSGSALVMTLANPASLTYGFQAASSAGGPWTDIPGATSPYSVPFSSASAFYRAYVNSPDGPRVYDVNTVGYINEVVAGGYAQTTIFNPLTNVTLQVCLPAPPDVTDVFVPNQMGGLDSYEYDSLDGWYSLDSGLPVGPVNLPTGTNFFVFANPGFIFPLIGEVGSLSISSPAISVQPQNVSALTGTTAGFTVQATGSPPLVYQWLFNGTSLTDGGRVSGTQTPNLSIANVQPSDAGAYSVRVTNAYGSAISAVANLAVQLPAPLAGLQHRYSFNGNANDSIGTANGILRGNALISGGKLLLNGSTGTYVDLPGGLVTSNSAVTIEAWVTFGISGLWARLFDFGSTSGYGTNTNGPMNFFWCGPYAGAGGLRSDISTTSGFTVLEGAPSLNGRTVQLVVVFDPAQGLFSCYTNGALSETVVAGNIPLSTVSTDDGFIGRSQFPADPYLNASIDEFRIYNGALSPSQIALDAAAGPDLLTTNAGNLVALRMNLPSTTMNLGQVEQMTLLGDFTTLSNVDLLTYDHPNLVTSDPNILTVTASGQLWAVGTGSAFVSAIYGGITNITAITVSNALALQLQHRYSFNANANDSVGSANGTLRGNALLSSGQLVLDGSAGTYLELPGGLVTSNSAVTIECWATFGASGAWARAFDFGSTAGYGSNTTGPANFFWCSPNSGSGTLRSDIATTSGYAIVDGAPSLNGRTVQLVVVCDPSNGLMAIYTNGAICELNAFARSIPLSTVSTDDAFIGRSQFPADAYLNGSIDELRIYNGVLMPREAATNFALGPNALQVPRSAPAITAQPLSQTNGGPAAALSVTAIGASPLSYHWQFNGTNLADNPRINGSQSSNLTIGNLILSDGGNYQVIISNAYGSATSLVAVLTVIPTSYVSAGFFRVGDGPSWTTSPPCYSAREAAALLFGGAPSEYAVSTDPNVINLSAWVDGYGDARYLATPVTEDFKGGVLYTNQGSYSAYVADHTSTSLGKTNYVWYAVAPAIVTQPQSQTGLPGGWATFKVAAIGDSNLFYQWNFNGASISGETNATLTVTGIGITNVGSYTVVVTNGFGAATSSVASLTLSSSNYLFGGAFRVGDGPAWNANPPCYSARQAAAMLFGGTASEYAISTDPNSINLLAWVDGWGDTNYLHTPTSEDFEKGVNYNDVQSFGSEYSAYVADHTGISLSKTNYAWYAVAPVIVGQPQNQTVAARATAAFNVAAIGAGPLAYQWILNGGNLTDNARISGSQSNVLNVANAGASDAGSYVVRISNAYGAVTSAVATLNVVPASQGLAAAAIASTPVTCGFWPVGTNEGGFIAASVDPLAPLVGTGVLFRGWQQPGGNTADTLNGAYLIYRYRLEFPTSVYIDSLKLGGAAFNGASAVLRLLNASGSPIAVRTNSGGNSYQTFTLTPPQTTGTVFFVDEYDTSTVWRYRDLLQIHATPAVLPTALPQPLSFVAGQYALLSLTATGTGPLSYQWQLNGSNLSDNGQVFGSQSNLLVLTNLLPGGPVYLGVALTDSVGASTGLVAGLTVIPVNSNLIGSAITWNGTISSNWDLVTFNWLASGLPTNYSQGNLVSFDDTLSGTPNVNLATLLTPGSITVSNASSNYVFSGSGRLSGVGGLVKNGSGSLTLAESGGDDFSGGITVNGGRLVLDDLSSAPGGSLMIGPGATAQVGSNDARGHLPTGNITLNGTLLFSRTNDLTVGNVISGAFPGVLVKSNANALILSGNNRAWTGTVAVAQGTLRLGAINAAGSGTNTSITISNGATLDVNGFIGTNAVVASGSGVGGAGAIVNNAAATAFPALAFMTLAGDTVIGGASRWDLRPAPAGTGADTVGPGFAGLSTTGHGYNLTKVGANFIGIVSATVDPALGNVSVQAGTLDLEGDLTGLGNPTNTLSVSSGATLELFNLTNRFNKVLVLNSGATLLNNSGASTIIGPVSLSGSGNRTFNIGGTSLAVSNVISGPGNLVKTGGSPLNLYVANSYTGSTLLNAGTLALVGAGSISGSTNISIAAGANLDATGRPNQTLTLAPGQTLQGNGVVVGAMVAGAGSTVMPGSSTAAIGALGVLRAVSLQGTTLMKLNAATGTNDELSASSVAYGGTLTLTNLSGTLASGNSFKLFNAGLYSGAFLTVTPATPGPGLLWDTTGLASSGVLGVVATNGLAIYQQPQPLSQRYTGGSLTLSLLAGGPGPLFYQWFNGPTAVPGATSANLTLNNLQLAQAGNYSCSVSNAFGTLTSSNAALVVLGLPTNSYPQVVLGDHALSYWRLDEGNGSPPAPAAPGMVARDLVGGFNGIYNANVELGLAGYSPSDADTAASFGMLATNGSYVGSISGIDFSEQGSNAQFSVEAWGLGERQPTDNGILTIGYGSGGEQFGLDANGTTSSRWRFFVRDSTGVSHLVTSTNGPDGTWHHLVGVCDQAGGQIRLYVDSVLRGTAPITPGLGVLPANTPLSIGARKAGLNSAAPDLQFIGTIDDVALYNYALSPAQVLSHYQAGGGGQAPPAIVAQPLSQTVAAGSTAVLTVTATGPQPLLYQWSFNGTNLADAGRISGSQSNTLSVANLQPGDAGNYQVVVANSNGALASAVASLTVVPATVVYFNDFQSGAGAEWSNTKTSLAPSGSRTFLGDFAAGTVSLTLGSLPAHQMVLVSLDLLIIQSWDGNTAGGIGPDPWDLSVAGGPTLLHSTFSNTGANDEQQSYPDPYPGGDHPAQAGAIETYSLGYPFYGDSVYHLTFAFPHSSNAVVLNFNGQASQGLTDESWGVDNVQVAVVSAGVMPTITSQPQDQVVASGSNATFTVAATGTASLGYQWSFDGGVLPGETSSTLSLPNAQVANAGFYQVLISNSFGSVLSRRAKLSVTGVLAGAGVAAPAGLVDWWPAEGNANDLAGTNNGAPSGALSYVPGQVGQAFQFDGGNAKIVLGASNLPPPWTACFWVNRQDCPTPSAALMGDSVSALKLEQFNGARQVGFSRFGTADYFFGYIAPAGRWVHLAFVGTSSNTLLYANGVLRGSVAVSIPLGRAYIGADLDGASDYVLAGLDEISVFNRALNASEINGLYAAGSVGQYVGPVPPVITLQPQSLGVTLGTGASFSIAATGAAPLNYQWQFNGVNLAGATGTSLNIASAVLGNSGNYQVLVTNVYGAATSAVATLAILNLPTISQPPSSAQVQVGGSATFTVVAFSSGTLNYQWLLEGDAIAGATRSSFTLTNAQLTDAGNYSVIVSNLAGSVTSPNATLLVVPAPPPTLVLSSYSVQFQAGLNLIANQLDQGGNTLAEILPVAPQGTVVSKYDNANGTWAQATYSNSAWMPSSILSLNPGEGAWLFTPSTFTTTFTGTPHTPSLPLAIPSAATWLVSRQTNDVGSYENIVGASPTGSAQVFQWNRTNQTFTTFTYGGGGWSGGQAPVVAVGESVWLAPQGGAPVQIPAAPMITQQPAGVVVGLGDSVTFLVAATGTQPLTYQWRLNNNAIPGATTTTLSLPNVQPGNAGNYDVVVNNPIGLAQSQIASLAISNLLILPFADNFTNAGTLGSTTNGSGFGSNARATVESGEPNPDDIPGGASVWLRWQPSVDGLASFTTAGSDFDTVLAIYTNTGPGLPALPNLALVAADDDSAAFLCSLINFSAAAGTTYYIQVDGYHGANGNIKLSWNFTPTDNFPPLILSQPQGQTVIAGSNVTLSVVVQAGPPVSYQWFSNYVVLPDATGPDLVMTPAQAGIYVVGVTNTLTKLGVLSAPADIQLIVPGVGQYGNPANVRAQDKLFDATALTPSDPNVPHDPTTASGFTDTQIFSSVNASADPSEPSHCGYSACKTVWNSFSNNLSGTLTITTVGTTFNAILEAYTGPGDSWDTLVPVKCSAGHGSAGESITFPYTAGTTIWVVVDGVNCASGNVTLNYNNVALPIIQVAPISQAIVAGGQLTLSAAVSSPPTLRYQWRMNGNNIAGATTSSLVVRDFQATNQGSYTLFAANGFGSVLSAGAQVVLNNPHFLNPAQSGTNFTATFVGLSNVSYVIQSSSDLKTWTPLKTNSSALGLFNFTDPIRSTTIQRFYRALQR